MKSTILFLIYIFIRVVSSKIKLNYSNSEIFGRQNASSIYPFTNISTTESKKSKRSTNSVCSVDGDLDKYDNIHCSTSVCSDDQFQCGNDNCIPLSYICDNVNDCVDNRDEAYCNQGGCLDKFRCYSGECLELDKKCNQEIECRDGWSDEYNCTQPHECPIHEGKFLCKSGGICIDAEQVCDGKIDCEHDESDEFPLCEDACRNSSCTHGCIPNPQIPTAKGSCYCFNGYELSNEDNRTCTDINECDIFGTCSQSCLNSQGSFECACISGFQLDADAQSCKLKGNNVSMVFALNSEIRVLNMLSESISPITNFGSPVGVTCDARNEWVYWTDTLEGNAGIYKSRLDGTEAQPVVTTGLGRPEGIAFDWIASNLYFVDTNRSHIVVCAESGNNCAVLLNKLDAPCDLALDPNPGYLFWTQWGKTPAINQAGMDGTNFVSIIEDRILWPNGIAVDVGNLRVYWSDWNTGCIESSNYNGKSRMFAESQRTHHPFSIDIFGDTLYWSDSNLHEIRFSNKFSDSKGHGTLTNGIGKYNGIAIYHISNQPITRTNHCEFAGCSHICVLSTRASSKCLCPIGYVLDTRYNKFCSRKSGYPHIVIGYNNVLKTLPMDTIGGNVFKSSIVQGVDEIISIISTDSEDNVILMDKHLGSMFQFNLLTEQFILLPSIIANGIDYDEIGGNLYWVDSHSVFVKNLRTNSQVIIENLRNMDATDVVSAPDLRKLFIAATGGNGGRIMVINMDGSDLHLLHDKIIGVPSSITYSKETRRVYWRTPGRIESVGIDGSNGLTQRVRAPSSIICYKGNIYWTDMESSLLRMHSEKYPNTASHGVGMFFGDYGSWSNGNFITEGVSAVVHITNGEKVYDKRLLVRHECSSRRNKCSHICLLSVEEYQGTCKCPEDLELDFDGTTCVVERNQENSVETVDKKETYGGTIFIVSALFVTLAIAFVFIWRMIFRRRATRRIVPTKYTRPATSQSTLCAKTDDE